MLTNAFMRLQSHRMDTQEPAGEHAAPKPSPSLFSDADEDRKHRCSSSGGYWHYAAHTKGKYSVVPDEEDGIFNSFPGSRKYTLRKQYDALKAKATLGNLTLARREYRPKVGYRLLKRAGLLELRFENHLGRSGKHYSVRLYFAEPDHCDRLLLALGATLKPLRNDVGGTQDRHIIGAFQRYDSGAELDPQWGLPAQRETPHN